MYKVIISFFRGGGLFLPDSLICPCCGGEKIEKRETKKGLYHCLDCRTDFGNAKGELYSPSMKYFSLNIKDVNKTETQVEIKNCDNTFSFIYERDGMLREGIIGKEEFFSFEKQLFNDLYIDKWKRNCVSYHSVVGIAWDLKISFVKKHSIFIHGFNCTPPLWLGLMKAIDTLVEMKK